MVNTLTPPKSYRLGKLILKWDDDTEGWVDEEWNVVFSSKQALLDAGATPIESECKTLNTVCSEFSEWMKAHSPDHLPTNGDINASSPHIKPQAESEEHSLDAHQWGGKCGACEAEPQAEEIKVPDGLWTSPAMHGFMKQVADMLNRHEQLLSKQTGSPY